MELARGQHPEVASSDAGPLRVCAYVGGAACMLLHGFRCVGIGAPRGARESQHVLLV